MQFDEVDRLLEPAPMALEMGYERLADGVVHVACRTDLHGCSGAMLEWWFRSRPDTQRYVWWHPVDHISSEWLEGTSGTHVGSIHQVEERVGELPPLKLQIQFRDAREFFDADRLRRARDTKAVSAALCAIIGVGWSPPRDADGRLIGGRLLHVGRDTSWGCVLRSHFFLGHDLARSGADLAAMQLAVPDAVAPEVLAHGYNEFTFLSRFLPSLYAAENRNVVPVIPPW